MADYTYTRERVDGKLTCPCGCGESPKGKRSVFCMGHDARLRERVIRAHLLGKTVAVVDDEGQPRSGDAMAIAELYGWEEYLVRAKQSVDLKAAGLVKKANANPRLEKKGQNDQFLVVAIYRNKNGSSDVEAIDRLGHKHWHHVDAKVSS